MSDTEEEGTFDKEAEREKLRKQLAREEEERRSTRHMSELLLKGATMTNKHCDDCGDPLFRYEGQEFCPTCGQAAAEGAEGGHVAADAGPGEDVAGGSADADSADRSAQTAGADRVEPGASASGGEPAQSASADAGETAAPGSAGQRPAPGASSEAGLRPGAGAGAAEFARTGGAGAGDVGGNVANARAALSRKLAALARQAEETDDVGRSRELLAAAREAAEALAAIDDVGR